MAQGAAQAVKDAAALGVILSYISTKGEIAQALRVYEGPERPGRKGAKSREPEPEHAASAGWPEEIAYDQKFASMLKTRHNPDR